ncbi:MBL fold metallo-hydrolase [Aestuariibacter salexigens]|uniref:MBL fold metallo-hydrolase n=1 Tax=Aestuariibacter salexigens TaxID=226010 RepID=UPI0004213682|nr:MBL fold metallo-hydrolase [Aestuariibacter salexigens]
MKLHQLNGYIQKIYLVEYDHGLLLLDGCCKPDVSLLRHFIEQQLGRPFNDLKLVVVTHMHPDHAGAAHKLRALTGCQIASANIDTPWYRGLNGLLMYLIDVVLTVWVAGRLNKPAKNVLYPMRLKPDVLLNDNDLLPGFEEWQVLTTPGHTDRDLSLWHKPSHKVYVADLIVQVKKRFAPPYPVFHPNKYRASLARIKDLLPNALWLAHVGEVSLREADYQHMMTVSPTKPKTPWRTTKLKCKQLLIRTR